MSPRQPPESRPPKSRPPKPPKAWAREAAGSYRSADGRFGLEGDGSGRWFVRDEAETDELGLPRTIGPFATLAAAQAAADARRGQEPAASPLAERRREAAGRVKASASQPGAGQALPRGDDAQAQPALQPAGGESASEPTKPPRRPDVRSAPPGPPSWLEALGVRDVEEAHRARSLIRALERLGFRDAEGMVRRDLLGGQPEVAARLLTEAIRRALSDDLATDRLVADAKRAGIVVAGDADAFATLVIARTLARLLEVVSGAERLEDAPAGLPGWQLLERAPERRRIRISARDVGEASS